MRGRLVTDLRSLPFRDAVVLADDRTCADPRGIGNLSELLGACAGKSLGLLAQGF